MRLSESLYASGVLNNGKVIHCNEWNIGDYNNSRNAAARLVRHARQIRINRECGLEPAEPASRWKNLKNVLRIG